MPLAWCDEPTGPSRRRLRCAQTSPGWRRCWCGHHGRVPTVGWRCGPTAAVIGSGPAHILPWLPALERARSVRAGEPTTAGSLPSRRSQLANLLGRAPGHRLGVRCRRSSWVRGRQHPRTQWLERRAAGASWRAAILKLRTGHRRGWALGFPGRCLPAPGSITSPRCGRC